MADPKQLQISLPGAGKSQTYQLSADTPVHFNFDISEAEFTGADGNLQIAIEGGGTIILEGYQALAEAGSLPTFQMMDGEVVAGDVYLFAFADQGDQTDLETAADGAATGSGAGAYSDDAGQLFAGLSALGGQGDAYDPHLLAAGVDTPENDPPTANPDFGEVTEQGEVDFNPGIHIITTTEFTITNPATEGEYSDFATLTALGGEGMWFGWRDGNLGVSGESESPEIPRDGQFEAARIAPPPPPQQDNPYIDNEGGEPEAVLIDFTLPQNEVQIVLGGFNERGDYGHDDASLVVTTMNGTTYTVGLGFGTPSGTLYDMEGNAVGTVQMGNNGQVTINLTVDGTDSGSFIDTVEVSSEAAWRDYSSNDFYIKSVTGIMPEPPAAWTNDPEWDPTEWNLPEGAEPTFANYLQYLYPEDDGTEAQFEHFLEDFGDAYFPLAGRGPEGFFITYPEGAHSDVISAGNLLANDTDVDHNHDLLRMSSIDYVGRLDDVDPDDGVDDGEIGTGVNPDGSLILGANEAPFSGFDPAEPPTTYHEIAGKYGTLMINALGDYQYILDPDLADHLEEGQIELEQFQYTIVDPEGAVSNTSTLTITVYGTNDAPVAVPDFNEAIERGDSESYTDPINHGDGVGGDIDLPDGNGLVEATGGGYGERITYYDGYLDDQDDAHSVIDITSVFAGGVNINGNTYTEISIGTNGAIAFGNHYLTLGPGDSYLEDSSFPVISLQQDDLDPGDGGEMYIDYDQGNGVITITWLNVLPFSTSDAVEPGGDYQNSMQLRLYDLGNGDFGVEIRYADISWVDSGTGGSPLGGWSNGAGDFEVIDGSGTTEFLNIEETSNVDHPGVYAWVVRDGAFGDLIEGNGLLHDFTAVERAEGNVLTDLYDYDGSDDGSALDLDHDGDVEGDAISVIGIYSHGTQQQETFDFHRVDAEGNPVDGFGPDAGTDTVVDDDGGYLRIWGEYGVLKIYADGEYTYTPRGEAADALNYDDSPIERFTYMIVDEHGAIDYANLSIMVHGANDAPEAYNDYNWMIENGEFRYPGVDSSEIPNEIHGNIIAGGYTNGLWNRADSDVDDDVSNDGVRVYSITGENGSGTFDASWDEGDALPAPLEIQGEYGTLFINADGSYTYELDDANETVQALNVVNGIPQTVQETFTYTTTNHWDDGVFSNEANLVITIKGSNDAPELMDDTPTMQIGEVVIDSFADAAGLESYTVNGITFTAQSTDGTPELDTVLLGSWLGVDHGRDDLSPIDGHNGDDAIRIDFDVPQESVEISLGGFNLLTSSDVAIATMYDSQGDEIGSVTLDADSGTNTFVLTAGSSYIDHVVVETDGLWHSEFYIDSVTATGVTATGADVHAVEAGSTNEHPLDAHADSDAVDVAGNVLLNDTDIDNEDYGDGNNATDLSVVGIASNNVPGNSASGNDGEFVIEGEFGTLTIHSDGSYTYSLDPEKTEYLNTDSEPVHDSFTYTATDDWELGNEGWASANATRSATLTITIEGTNDAPIARPDFNFIRESLGGDVFAEDTTTLAGHLNAGVWESDSFSITAGTAFRDGGDVDFTAGGRNLTEGSTYAGIGINSPGNSDINNTEVDTLNGWDGRTEALSVDFANPMASVTITLSSLFNAESGLDGTFTETARLIAYDSDGNQLGYLDVDGTVSGEATVTLDGASLGTDSLIAQVVAMPINNGAGRSGNNSDFLIQSVSGTTSAAVAQVDGNVIEGAWNNYYHQFFGRDSDNDNDRSELTVIDVEQGGDHGSTGDLDGVDYAFVLQGQYGTLYLQANGDYTYVEDPAATDPLNWNDLGEDVFSYTISDKQTGLDSANDELHAVSTLTIKVFGSNDAPVAENDAASMIESVDVPESTAGGNVLSNDTDVDNVDIPDNSTDPVELSVTGVSADTPSDSEGTSTTYGGETYDYVAHGHYGDLYLNNDGTYLYVENPGATDSLNVGDTATDSFTYTVSDNEGWIHGKTDSATLTITITGANDAAVISGDTSGSVTEDAPEDLDGGMLVTTGNLLSEDVDNADDLFQVDEQTGFDQQTDEHGGVFQMNQNGEWTYEISNASVQHLGRDASFESEFTVKSIDGTEQIVTVTVNGVNDAPVAENDYFDSGLKTFTVDTFTGAAGQHDLDADGMTFTAMSYLDTDNAQLTTNQNGLGVWDTYEYDGDPSVDGAINPNGVLVSFDQPTENATIVLSGFNANQTYWQEFDDVVTFKVHDADGGEATITRSFFDGFNGTLELTSADTETGADITSVEVWAAPGLTDFYIQSVSAEMTAPFMEDAGPIVLQVSDILNNDTDVDDGDVLGLDWVFPVEGEEGYDSNYAPVGGYAVLNGDGTVTFVPDANFNGLASFWYTANDGDLDSNPAKVELLINPTDDPIIANPDVNAVSEDADALTIYGNVLAGDDHGGAADVAVDGFVTDPVTLISTPNGTYGTLTLNADGTYSYTLDNDSTAVQSLAEGQTVTDVFTYEVQDAQGPENTAQTTLTITITGTNDAPVATGETAGPIEEGSAYQQIAFLSDNWSDIDNGSALASSNPYAMVGDAPAGVTLDPQTGAVYFDATDPAYDYLAPEESTQVSFNYTVTDDHGAVSNEATVIITVTGTNDAPVLDLDAGTLNFVYEEAGYNNMLGVYQMGPNGPVNPEIILANVNDSDPATAGDQAWQAGDVITTYGDGVELHYFLVSVGEGSTPTGTPEFVWVPGDAEAGTEGEWAISFDGGNTVYDARFDDMSLNPNDPETTFGDGSNIQGQDSPTYDVEVEVDDQLIEGGPQSGDDDDYDDIVADEVDGAPGRNYASGEAMAFHEDGSAVRIAAHVDISDVDSDTMSGMTIVLQQEGGDTLNIPTGAGYDVSDPDNSVPGQTTYTITGEMSKGAYEDLIESITYQTSAQNIALDGSDFRTITITIADGDGGTSTATSTITLIGYNNAPPAADDNVTTDYETSTLIDVLDNDGPDPDGDSPLLINNLSTPAHGSAVIENGQVRYTPEDGFSGEDSFTYRASDGHGGLSDEVTVTVTVEAPDNTPPVAVEDDGTAVESVATNTSYTGEALEGLLVAEQYAYNHNNSSWNWTDASLTEGSSGHYGVGSYQESPGGFTGNETAVNGTFQRMVVDFDGDMQTATSVTIVGSGSNASIRVFANDVDVTDSLDITIPGNTIIIAQTGSTNVEYDEIQITPGGSSNKFWVVGVNSTPADGGTTVWEGNVLANDYDAEDDDYVNDVDINTQFGDAELVVSAAAKGDYDEDQPGEDIDYSALPSGTFTAVTAAGVDIAGDHGTLHIAANGEYTYTPTDPNDMHAEVFTYQVMDQNGAVDYALINVGEDAPVAQPPVGIDDLGGVGISSMTNWDDADGLTSYHANGMTFTGTWNNNSAELVSENSDNWLGVDGGTRDGSDIGADWYGTDALNIAFDEGKSIVNLKFGDWDGEDDVIIYINGSPTAAMTYSDSSSTLTLTADGNNGGVPITSIRLVAADIRESGEWNSNNTEFQLNSIEAISIISGSVLDNDFDVDTPHADLFVTEVTGAVGADADGSDGFSVEGQYGVLHITDPTTGAYTYELYTESDSSAGHVGYHDLTGSVTETFSYTVSDPDGGTDTATLEIPIHLNANIVTEVDLGSTIMTGTSGNAATGATGEDVIYLAPDATEVHLGDGADTVIVDADYINASAQNVIIHDFGSDDTLVLSDLLGESVTFNSYNDGDLTLTVTDANGTETATIVIDNYTLSGADQASLIGETTTIHSDHESIDSLIQHILDSPDNN